MDRQGRVVAFAGRFRAWPLIGAVCVVLCSACRAGEFDDAAGDERDPADAVAELTEDEAQQARFDLRAWFECEECDDGQLDAVVALGSAATPTLAATLRHGPAPERLASVERHLADSYSRLVAYSIRHPEAAPEMTEVEYVATYAENFVALYKVRAAVALGAIAGRAAADSLTEIRLEVQTDTSLARYDVRRSIEAAFVDATTGP